MLKQIFFLGDTSLQTAASYLAGCLHHSGWTFDYLPSDQPLTELHLAEPHQLYIISDYPAENISVDLQKRLVENVTNGSNLLMIGGWESFHGMGGNWDGTPIANFLPVEVASEDDRRNCDSPVFLKAHGDHPILSNLPWNDRTPLIGGYNRVIAKRGVQTLLTAERYTAVSSNGDYKLSHESSDPLLVVEENGSSRIATLLTDLAPHWVGPLVDWGDDRIAAQAPNAEGIEVGNLYYQFVSQLISWIGQFPLESSNSV